MKVPLAKLNVFLKSNLRAMMSGPWCSTKGKSVMGSNSWINLSTSTNSTAYRSRLIWNKWNLLNFLITKNGVSNTKLNVNDVAAYKANNQLNSWATAIFCHKSNCKDIIVIVHLLVSYNSWKIKYFCNFNFYSIMLKK